ncbi:MAG TPA: hypothetical protein VHS35_24605 [Pseudonocardia sp.]|nr:hypothetical protein [Pseudonocardia sp.]
MEAVEVRGLRRAYGGAPAVDGVDLTIAPGGFADRVVLLRDSRVAADGSVAQVRAAAAGRVVSATVADAVGLAGLPGVSRMRVEGSRIHLTCGDSDLAVRALLAALASAAQFLPSYWIVAETLGQVSGAGLDAGGVLVLLAWLVAVGALVIVRYRRDALRV